MMLHQCFYNEHLSNLDLPDQVAFQFSNTSQDFSFLFIPVQVYDSEVRPSRSTLQIQAKNCTLKTRNKASWNNSWANPSCTNPSYLQNIIQQLNQRPLCHGHTCICMPHDWKGCHHFTHAACTVNTDHNRGGTGLAGLTSSALYLWYVASRLS